MKNRYRLFAFLLVLIMGCGLAVSAMARVETCGVCGARTKTTYGEWLHVQRITEIRNGDEVWANYEQTRNVMEKCPTSTDHHYWHGSENHWQGWRFEYYVGR